MPDAPARPRDRRLPKDGLAMKGERPSEIEGLARAMHAHAHPAVTGLGGGPTCGGNRSAFRSSHRVVAPGRRWPAASASPARQPVGVEPLRARTSSRLGAPRSGAGVVVAERCLEGWGSGSADSPHVHARRCARPRVGRRQPSRTVDQSRRLRGSRGRAPPEFTGAARAIAPVPDPSAPVTGADGGVDEIDDRSKISECRDGSVNMRFTASR